MELSDPALEHDGLRLATVKSRALGRRGDASFWVPQAERIDTLLILLHGVWGSHWVWSQKGAAHRIAQRMVDAGEIAPMVLAMPSDGLGRDGSGYLSWPGGSDVERWIVDEVPALARLAAPALASNAAVAIAGLSMGGYGALRLGAKYPERFRAIVAHSAIAGIEDFAGFVEEPLSEYRECAPAEELETAYWIQRNRERLPPLRFDCGVDDPLIQSNRRLHETLLREQIPHTWAEYGGGHEWSYWQQHLPDTLRHVHQHCSRKATP
ncbi:alpha/beta hydrolase [Terriglobus sp.]|uniref:alpha/beta hydrolase n=1 Tax=Terriglobus sp. TaxID=1889013 RepID=UPI003AFF9557